PPVTSSVNEVPPLPMAATLPATDLVDCFSDCDWPDCEGIAEYDGLVIPRVNKPATEIPQRNLRIIELGISLLVIEGGVWCFRQVGFRSSAKIKNSDLEEFYTWFGPDLLW